MPIVEHLEKSSSLIRDEIDRCAFPTCFYFLPRIAWTEEIMDKAHIVHRLA